ncbi:hypothetical protein EV715DRAFT_295478 [Schizophyllum commune]
MQFVIKVFAVLALALLAVAATALPIASDLEVETRPDGTLICRRGDEFVCCTCVGA